MAIMPVMPVSGRGRARYQPLWADDAAACVVAALERAGGSARHELAGPDVLTHDDVVRLAIRAAGRDRPLVHVPTPLVSRGLRALEVLMKSKAPVVWDEAELMEVSLVSERGTSDAEALGVHPRRMADVLGVAS